MKIVAGLGNPGKKYEGTPHNTGFEVADELSRLLSCDFRRSLRFKARIASGTGDGQDVLLVKPQTFMNRSGVSVASVMRYRKLTPADLVIVVDDADLPLGRIRIRPNGGSGGHRGMASIIESVGSSDFARVRIGVGHDERGRGLVQHVLSRFSADEREIIGPVIKRAAQAVMCIVSSGAETAMNEFNGLPPDQDI